MVQPGSPRARRNLFGVTLRAQPRDAAVAIHPFVNLGFGFETGDWNGFAPRAFCQNLPIAFSYPDRFKSNFRFCHKRFYGDDSRTNQTSSARCSKTSIGPRAAAAPTSL